MKRVAFYVLSVFLALAILELSCRLLLAIPYVADRRMFHDDLSWRRSWVHRHHNSPEIRYEFDIYDRTKGWLAKPNLRNTRVFGDKILNTNAKGLRGTTDYAYGKHPHRTRVLLLGDSFTFGDGVSDTETYAAVLHEMLPHVEIINMGVHGYGHDQMLIFFKEEGVKYDPDVVILGFVQKDMERNLLQFRDYAKPKFVVDQGELKLVGSPVPRPEDILRWDWVRPRLEDMWSIAAHEFKKWTGIEGREEATITTHILNEMIHVAEGIHAKPVFVYLPVGDEIVSRLPLTPGERFLFAFCRAHQEVHCFSARPAFAAALARGATFKLTGHWGPAGHRVVAQAIQNDLLHQGDAVPPSAEDAAIAQPGVDQRSSPPGSRP